MYRTVKTVFKRNSNKKKKKNFHCVFQVVQWYITKPLYCTFENTKKAKQKKTQTHHTQNKTKCIHEHNNMATKQSTLFGGLAKARSENSL